MLAKSQLKNIITIPGTEVQPEIIFDFVSGCMYIEGISMPLNARNFYNPLIDWVSWIKVNEFELHINLDFFDTLSSKMLLDLMRAAVLLKESGRIVNIYWYTLLNDYDLHEAGKDYEIILKHEFIFVVKEDVYKLSIR